jgi:hypothetical protein
VWKINNEQFPKLGNRHVKKTRQFETRGKEKITNKIERRKNVKIGDYKRQSIMNNRRLLY